MMITVHAFVAFAWMLAAVLQAFTGAVGIPGDAKKRIHRIVGWVAAPLGLASATLAIIATLVLPINRFTVPVVANGMMIFLNILMGLCYARQRMMHLHKAAMVWAIVWSCVPGIARI